VKLRRRRPPCRCSAIAEQHRAALQLAAEMASWPAPVEVLREEVRPVRRPGAPLVPPAGYPSFHFDAGERQLLGETERWTWPRP
jgi:hypothetical protein